MEGEEGRVGEVVEEEGGAGGRGDWCWWALCDSLERSRDMEELLNRQTTSLSGGTPYLMTGNSDNEGTCYKFLLSSNLCRRRILSDAFFGTLSAFVRYDFQFLS